MNNTILISTLCNAATNNIGGTDNSIWSYAMGFQILFYSRHLYYMYSYTSVLLQHAGNANPFLNFCLSSCSIKHNATS